MSVQAGGSLYTEFTQLSGDPNAGRPSPIRIENTSVANNVNINGTTSD